jgi:hypothetical protein
MIYVVRVPAPQKHPYPMLPFSQFHSSTAAQNRINEIQVGGEFVAYSFNGRMDIMKFADTHGYKIDWKMRVLVGNKNKAPTPSTMDEVGA